MQLMLCFASQIAGIADLLFYPYQPLHFRLYGYACECETCDVLLLELLDTSSPVKGCRWRYWQLLLPVVHCSIEIESLDAVQSLIGDIVLLVQRLIPAGQIFNFLIIYPKYFIIAISP